MLRQIIISVTWLVRAYMIYICACNHIWLCYLSEHVLTWAGTQACSMHRLFQNYARIRLILNTFWLLNFLLVYLLLAIYVLFIIYKVCHVCRHSIYVWNIFVFNLLHMREHLIWKSTEFIFFYVSKEFCCWNFSRLRIKSQVGEIPNIFELVMSSRLALNNE